MACTYMQLLEQQDHDAAMTVVIQRFCKAWVAWVDAGIPHGQIMFSKHLGLCDNLPYWMMDNGYDLSDRYAALRVMCQDFLDTFGSGSFPFSTRTPGLSGRIMYHQEKREGTMHLNEKRVAWAREQAAKLTKENV